MIMMWIYNLNMGNLINRNFNWTDDSVIWLEIVAITMAYIKALWRPNWLQKFVFPTKCYTLSLHIIMLMHIKRWLSNLKHLFILILYITGKRQISKIISFRINLITRTVYKFLYKMAYIRKNNELGIGSHFKIIYF